MQHLRADLLKRTRPRRQPRQPRTPNNNPALQWKYENLQWRARFSEEINKNPINYPKFQVRWGVKIRKIGRIRRVGNPGSQTVEQIRLSQTTDPNVTS